MSEKDFKDRLKKLAMGAVGVGVSAGIAVGASGCMPKDIEKESNEKTTSYTENINKNSNQEIKSINGVEKDFVGRYLEAYNKKYGTSYEQIDADMYTTSLEEGVVYEVDGKLVTRGSHPDETRAILENIGEVKLVSGYSNVMQIVVEVEGKNTVLGTYDISTGKFLYSGNQLEDIQDTDFEAPELENIGIDSNVAKRASEVLQAEDVESEISIQARINLYKKAIYDNKEKGFEPGD